MYVERFKRRREGYLLPSGGGVWNVEPAQSPCNLIKALIPRDWGQRAPEGMGRWGGEERAEGEGQGGGLGVEFTTTPAWALEP